jgi:hypothetical protein
METLRADYIHENKYAALGEAVLWRCPVAFLSRNERRVDHPELPDALRLADVASILENR